MQYLGTSPLVTLFPGPDLPRGMGQFPVALAPGSHVLVAGQKLRISIDPAAVGMVLSQQAPRVLIPLAEDDGQNFYLVFKMSAGVTDPSATTACGVGVYDVNDPLFTHQPLIEFGDTGLVPVYSSTNSDVIEPPSPTVHAPSGAAPWWIRVVRADAVVYAEWCLVDGAAPDTVPLSGWVRFDDSAQIGSRPRSGRPVPLGGIMLFVRAADASPAHRGMTLLVSELQLYTWSRYSSGQHVGSLRAVSWPEGKRIDLSWVNPEGADAPKAISLRRSTCGHQEFMPQRTLTPPPEGVGLSGFGEEVYRGPPISSYTDKTVAPGEFVYYSVFLSRAPLADTFPLDRGTLREFANQPGNTDWGPQVPPSNKVTGLSARDRFEQLGPWHYQLFPQKYRDDDRQDADDQGAATGYLERFSRFLQAGTDLMHGHITGFGLLNNPDRAPLGLVGISEDQTSIVDGFLRDFGFFPGAAGLDSRTKRKLWRFGLGLIKLKGSLEGCCRFVKVVTGWDNAVCVEPGVKLNLRWLRTWDGFTTRKDYTLSGLTYSPGKISGITGLPPHRYRGGLFVDFFGSVQEIADNTATEIQFVNQAFTPSREVVLGGSSAATRFTIKTMLAGQTRPPNDYAWDRGEAWDQSTPFAQRKPVKRTGYGPMGTAYIEPAPGPVAPAAVSSVAFKYLDGGAGAWANRVPVHHFWLFTGEPSWLLHPACDTTLAGTATDPFYRLWPGIDPIGSGKLYPMTDFDFLVYAPPGAAIAANLPVGIVAPQSIGVKGGPIVDPGTYINPNRNQDHWFRITGLTFAAGFTVYIVVSDDDVAPNQVCLPGDLVTLAPRVTVQHDRDLRALMPLMLPWDSRLFIYYQ